MTTRLPWDELKPGGSDKLGILISTPLDLVTPTCFTPVEGTSNDAVCEECLCAVRLSPASRQMLLDPPDGRKLFIVCWCCFDEHCRDGFEEAVVELFPGQADELRKAGLDPDVVAQQRVAAMRQMIQRTRAARVARGAPARIDDDTTRH